MGFWRSIRYDIEQRWPKLIEKYQLARKWFNDHPGIIIIIAVASVSILLVTAIAVLTPEKPPKLPESKKAWFYDLNTGELFVDKADEVPPIEAPSGPLPNGQPAGVKAYVLTYVSEPNESEKFIGFLETTNPDAQAQYNGSGHWGQGKIIRRLEDQLWVPGDSKQARAILEEAFRPNENGEPPRYCPPE